MSSFEEIRKTLQDNDLNFQIGKRNSFTWNLFGSKASEMQVVNVVNRSLNTNFNTQYDIERHILSLRNEGLPNSKKGKKFLLPIPKRDFSEIDNKVYEGKVKRLQTPDGSDVWMVKDRTAEKGNIWYLTPGRKYLPEYDKDYFQRCVDKCNEMLTNGVPESVALNQIPLVLFEKRNEQCGGVEGICDEDGKLLEVSPKWTSRDVVFDGMIAQDVFSSQNKLMDQLVTDTQPEPFTNDSDQIALAYCDLTPFDYKEEEINDLPTPAWDSWFEKFEEHECDIISAYIWSVFDITREHNEILWIFDDGGTGKSTFIDALTDIFNKVVYMAPGHNSVACSPNGLHHQINDKYFNAQIYDKRLLIVPECRNDRFIEESIIHSISGKDSIPVEQKYEKVFSYKPKLRLFIMSNVWPKVDSDQENETRRLIPIRSKSDYKLEKEIKNFRELLVSEYVNFLKKCHYRYDKINVDGSIISREEHRERIEEILPKSDTQIYYSDIFTVADPESFITTEECVKAIDAFNSTHHMKLKNDARSICSFLTGSLGAIQKQGRIEDPEGHKVLRKGYKGIKLKEEFAI